jgi:hypothetical protein
MSAVFTFLSGAVTEPGCSRTQLTGGHKGKHFLPDTLPIDSFQSQECCGALGNCIRGFSPGVRVLGGPKPEMGEKIALKSGRTKGRANDHKRLC